MENKILAWSFVLNSTWDRTSTSGSSQLDGLFPRWLSWELEMGLTVLTTWNLDLLLCSSRTDTLCIFVLHWPYHVVNSDWKILWSKAVISLITFCKPCRQKQSSKQILALTLLISAAVLLSVGESSSKGSKGGSSDYVLLYGIIPVTVASMLSGLASSLCQWASQVELTYHVYFPGYLWSLLTCSIIVQVKKHTSYMMTIEMSFIGSMCLLASTYRSPDGEAIRKYGFFHEWTLWTVVSTLWYSLFSPLTVG
jgi:hypothetical protein